MAISKLLYIADCGGGYSGKHLNKAIDYIMAQKKTGGGKWTAAFNCQKEYAYEQMHSTKEHFGKTDQRQGYHLIISFVEGEVDADQAFEIIGKFAKEYLSQDYETVYSVHNNTDHVHGHLIFNSVSFRTGKKYHYKRGDWAKHIQPITNRLCKEYGLSTIEITEDRAAPSERFKEWNDFSDGKFLWKDMIKRDLDICIMQADTFESFLDLLVGMGYEVKQGKHLAIRPMKQNSFCRCRGLGEHYTEERIRERILTEHVAKEPAGSHSDRPHIIRCRIRRVKRVKLSGIQKQYFARLYRTGLLKKRPYSQAYLYRADIRRMKYLQEEYLYLSRHCITGLKELVAAAQNADGKRIEVSRSKSQVYKEREKFKSLFDAAEAIENLQDCENSYQRGEMLFEEEHVQYLALLNKLHKNGYTMEKIGEIREHFRTQISELSIKEKAVKSELCIANRLVREMISIKSSRQPKKEECLISRFKNTNPAGQSVAEKLFLKTDFDSDEEDRGSYKQEHGKIK